MWGLVLALGLATSILGLLALAAGYVANWQNRRRPFLWGFAWGLLTALGPVLVCAEARGAPAWLLAAVPAWLSPIVFLAGGLGFPLLFAHGQPGAPAKWLYAQLVLIPALAPAAFLSAMAALCAFT